MPESRTVTGHTIAMVKLADGGEVAVRMGESLPEALAKGEVERLDRLGAFGAPRVADLYAQGARLLNAGALPPQMTLAANPEPDDGPLLDTGEGPELFSQAEIDAAAAAAAAGPKQLNVNPEAPAPTPPPVVPPAPPAPPAAAPAAPPAPPAAPAAPKAADLKAAVPPKK